MQVKWTEEQNKVITLRDRSILVSAAAGSGKTAVLVERIIQMITDKTHPVDIDRFLVVTFTKAAAAEMRERIREALEEKVEADPENIHLMRQLTLIANAQIMTIDSFCSYIVRNYFHQIDMEPNFRVAETGELKLMTEDAVADVLEEAYEKKDEAFLRFVEGYAPGKRDDALKEMILRLYDFSQSHPWPSKWLDECKKAYEINSIEELLDTAWMKAIKEYIDTSVNDWYQMLECAQNICEMDEGPYMYAENIENDLKQIEKLKECRSILEYEKAFQVVSFGRLSTKRGFEGSEELKEQVKTMRSLVKDGVKDILKKVFYMPISEVAEQMQHTKENAEVLINLTEEFLHKFDEKKAEHGVLDFSDLEHCALKILVDEESGKPTDSAEELQGMIDEIMIDEYQDSNYVQEAILTAISGVAQGRQNLFMVGDVKQSIYRFRMARPELFMQKYEDYMVEDSECQRVNLTKNFRSRKEVIQTVNDVFYHIMHKDLGKVAYDDDAALYQGSEFVEADEPEMFASKVLLLDPELGEEVVTADTKVLEARMIARDIRQMMQTQKVTDKGTKKLRPIRYSDIVILLRSMSGAAEIFVEELSRCNVPARSALSNGYFQTTEIKMTLELLRLVDNPRQDIPLAAVLHSPIVNLTEEELAMIRIDLAEGFFYQAAEAYAENGSDDTLKAKMQNFYEMIKRFREYAQYMALHDLLSVILKETGYLDFISAMPSGKQRRANVKMLIEQAISYEKSGYRGLFRFINYIDRLEKYEVDYGEADVAAEEDNVVQVMSIHKSKGLEFPVVYVAAMGKKFNRQDLSGKMIMHPDYGVGLEEIDVVRRTKRSTLMRNAFSQMLQMDNQGEEMRVLYVALTRAKEKLIFTGVQKKTNEKKIDYIVQNMYSDDRLELTTRLKAVCYLDWVLPALLKKDYPMQIVSPKELEDEEMSQAVTEGISRMSIEQMESQASEQIQQKVTERLEYNYPYEEDIYLKTKKSVSELKHRAMELSSEEEIPFLVAETVEKYEPQFIQKKAEVNQGALRGTAMHRVMECFDYTWEYADAKTLDEAGKKARCAAMKEQIANMVADGRLSEELYELINVRKLESFFDTELSLRMHRAAVSGNLFQEQPFVMGMPASEVEETKSSELMLIQGIIDVFFIEDDHIVLLDYKTDNVNTPEQLVSRYQVQLALYAEAIAKGQQMPVTETLLYSFKLGCVIDTKKEKIGENK